MIDRGRRMTLLELQTAIHKQNVEAGWWDKPRSFSVLTNLIQTEISEAVEADRCDLMDDKLVSYKGMPVECADACIRMYDVLSSLDNEDFQGNGVVMFLLDHHLGDNHYLLALASWCITNAWEEHELESDLVACKEYLVTAIHCLYGVIENYDIDPQFLIREKMAYNRTRADHKKENRAKPHGKAY